MEIAIAFIALGGIVLIGYLVNSLMQANTALRDIATEAILATRSHSAEELAQASAHAHLMRAQIQAPAQTPSVVDVPPNDPDKVQLKDGTILNVLRPFG